MREKKLVEESLNKLRPNGKERLDERDFNFKIPTRPIVIQTGNKTRAINFIGESMGAEHVHSSVINNVYQTLQWTYRRDRDKKNISIIIFFFVFSGYVVDVKWLVEPFLRIVDERYRQAKREERRYSSKLTSVRAR